MSKNISKETKYGGIDISIDAIASVAGNAVLECYGVVGLASKSSIKDNILELLKAEEYNKGVYARKTQKGYEVDLYVSCAFGVKIPEVLSEVQKKVKYVLETTFGIKILAVNVFVQDLKEI